MIEIMEHGNSGIKVFSYKGQKALQVVGVESAFDQLAESLDSPVKTIIEIGTDFGGLTNLLADIKISESAEIHTYDINKDRFISHNNKIQFHCKNVFSAEQEIKDLIQSEGKTLLLCDGGNKQKEFEVFHKYLKSGDIIMAHDYAPNAQAFAEDYISKIWNWHEFQDSFADFKGLEPYMQNLFKKYSWCIRKRA
jgi:cephalosporin hydroxylase